MLGAAPTRKRSISPTDPGLDSPTCTWAPRGRSPGCFRRIYWVSEACVFLLWFAPLAARSEQIMRFVTRCLAKALLALAVVSCSSDKSAGTPDGGGGATTGAGGKTSSAGSKGSGGTTANMCAVDAGSSGCRACLAMDCCGDLTGCLADPVCSKALTKHEACFNTPGEDPSACFSELTRTLKGDSGAFPPIAACIVTSCTMICGGPQSL